MSVRGESRRAKRILIVEDEGIIAEDLARSLHRMGYEIVGTVASGEEAVALAARSAPDLVLMDIELEGEMDGIEAASRIRTGEGAAVVYLTAHEEKELFERAKVTGPYGYLSKPVSKRELQRVIETALYKNEMEQRLRENQQRLELALEGAELGLWDWDLVSGTAIRDERTAAIYGCELVELAPDFDTWLTKIHPDDRATVLETLHSHLRGETPTYEAEYRIMTRSGQTKWVLDRGKVVERERDGAPARVTGTLVDINDRKLAEMQIIVHRDLSVSLSAVSELGEALDLCIDAALRVSGVDAAGIYLVNEELGLDLAAHQGLSPEYLATASRIAADSPCAHLVTRGRPLYYAAEDQSTDLRLSPKCHDPSLVAVIPIQHDGRSIGCFNLVSKSSEAISEQTGQALETIAADVGSAIVRIRAQEALRKAHDQLEKRVKDRTVELLTADSSLRREMAARIESDEALRESEERYRLLTQNSLTGIYIHQDRIFLYVNDRLANMLGYEPHEMIGQEFWRYVHPADRELVKQRGIARSLGEDMPPHYEFRAVCKDGTTIWVELLATAISYGGRPANMGNVADITFRKHAEDALRESEEKYRLVVENANEMIFVVQDHTVRFANSRAYQALGYSEEEFASRHFLDFVHPEDRATVAERHGKRLKGRVAPNAYSFRVIDKAGDIWWAYMSMISIEWKDRPATLVFGTDITDLKRAESENVAKSQFLATVSHELRTPLNAIIGFSEVLEDQKQGRLNDPQLVYVRQILGSGRHLLHLIDEMLDLTRIDAGRMELHSSPVEVPRLLSEILALFSETAVSRGLTTRLYIQPASSKIEIMADDRKLRQIMVNLLSNALKFTPAGGGITVEAVKTDENLKVTVSDTGIGLDPEHLESIFGAFEQVDTSLSREREGTGIGLALTRRLIQLHGGRIWAHSDGPGKGSAFTFTIPVANRQNLDNGEPAA